MSMSTSSGISQKSLQWARENKKQIAQQLTSKDCYPAEENPVSIFMAGSPGAGKTEVSRHLIASDLFE